MPYNGMEPYLLSITRRIGYIDACVSILTLQTAMFASFAVEPGDFIGITENDGGTMDARFGGKYKYTLNLEKETYKPIAISVQTDTDTYKVLFSGAEKQ